MQNTVTEAEVVQTNAVAVREQPPQVPALWGTTDQREIIRKASDTASALRDVMRKQGLMSNIKGKEYPRCEAWTLAGTMLGVFPVLVWSRPVDGGWEARVEARTLAGAIVGAAEAECLRNERNWSDRDDFALRSMAQTRATAKALRMPLGFVMTLAGFEPTPSEEMTQDMDRTPAPAKPATPKVATATPKVACATAEQRTKMIGLFGSRGLATDYFVKLGAILETETLEDLPLRYVPATAGQMRKLGEKIAEFEAGEAALPAFLPNDEPEAPKMPAKASKSPQDAPEQGEMVKDTRQRVTGTLQSVSIKTGTKKNGEPWTLYGLKIGKDYFNTFHRHLGEMAQENEGQTVTLYFQQGENGKDAIELVDAQGNSSEQGAA